MSTRKKNTKADYDRTARMRNVLLDILKTQPDLKPELLKRIANAVQ